MVSQEFSFNPQAGSPEWICLKGVGVCRGATGVAISRLQVSKAHVFFYSNPINPAASPPLPHSPSSLTRPRPRRSRPRPMLWLSVRNRRVRTKEEEEEEEPPAQNAGFRDVYIIPYTNSPHNRDYIPTIRIHMKDC